jgi:UDP-glucuronate decarboxylase
MLQLAQLVLELTGRELAFERRPLPADDPRQRKPDIRRAQQLIQFEPKVSLREGLLRTIDDFQTRYAAREGGESERQRAR